MNTTKSLRPFLLFLSLLSYFYFETINSIRAQTRYIKNDSFWKTTDGKAINSQGGGVFKFKDPKSGTSKYFWYGVHYDEADLYRNDPSVTYPNATFESVSCYSSTDLINWKDEGDVLSKTETNKNGKTWVGRLGVAYIQQLKKYAMFVQHGNQVLITISDTPNGQFTWYQKINMEPLIGTTNTGDQTVFTDEDTKKSYLIYSYGRGRNKIYVSEIGVKDGKIALLDCTEIFKGESREGNCMFKYKGKYYMYASNIYGWDSSLAYYLVADDVKGPYLPINKMLVTDGSVDDYAHVSQTGFFINVKGTKTETVIFCGDRWSDFAGNGLGYNQWCPLSFDGDIPYFNSLNTWKIDAKTGNWTVAKDNDFVKNGSFEADRKRIPSIVKPVQTQLTGWFTEIIEGNKISLDSLNSPNLNHFNTATERKIVIGEKSLNISDKINFKRKISQIIASTKYVQLADGIYNLSAKVKNDGNFNNLEMFALSGGKKFTHHLEKANENWKHVVLKGIKISDGKIEIGFLAEGKPNAICLIDDVSLVKIR
ncbi:family 43 glycosylhydrolase [Pedobacter jejuensis]|uniref:Beta-xylosidase n=1 Tax=Pedobacter jejuensis TaxID=1268550 RepID=A0A3N0BV78_9SPHI|nr:family 43 glycosylhydrolase [Pedobacter jejuensis]RNL52602.1 beta-xylosidase [Pedobacter jejuensis]